mmetsp:Transcript_5840/g.11992  ORF Transcript_5840/g.11992 Transcript_5840/m.11992 type:complete len:238 (-) Transcript_5840:221-934(-)
MRSAPLPSATAIFADNNSNNNGGIQTQTKQHQQLTTPPTPPPTRTTTTTVIMTITMFTATTINSSPNTTTNWLATLPSTAASIAPIPPTGPSFGTRFHPTTPTNTTWTSIFTTIPRFSVQQTGELSPVSLRFRIVWETISHSPPVLPPVLPIAPAMVLLQNANAEGPSDSGTGWRTSTRTFGSGTSDSSAIPPGSTIHRKNDSRRSTSCGGDSASTTTWCKTENTTTCGTMYSRKTV